MAELNVEKILKVYKVALGKRNKGYLGKVSTEEVAKKFSDIIGVPVSASEVTALKRVLGIGAGIRNCRNCGYTNEKEKFNNPRSTKSNCPKCGSFDLSPITDKEETPLLRYSREMLSALII
jgi:hypothetical protein